MMEALVTSQHKGLEFEHTYTDAMADQAAAITWNFSYVRAKIKARC